MDRENEEMGRKRADNTRSKARPVRRGDGPQIVYDYIRGEILAARVQAGARIDEASIASTLGLSRTPVRQALMRLATEGLLEISPNHGARVPPLEFEEVHSFFEAFEYLMRATSYLAAKYREDDDIKLIRVEQTRFDAAARSGDIRKMIDANEAFHIAIAQAGRNKELSRFMADLLARTLRLDSLWYRRQSAEDAPRVFRRSSREHAELVKAILDGNPQGSMAAASRHVASFREPFLTFLASSDVGAITPPA